MRRLKSKVKILSSRKTDGRYNSGMIVGVSLASPSVYIGYVNENEFLARFTTVSYKIAYIDCVTKNACVEWFSEKDIGAR